MSTFGKVDESKTCYTYSKESGGQYQIEGEGGETFCVVSVEGGLVIDCNDGSGSALGKMFIPYNSMVTSELSMMFGTGGLEGW